jgi:CMP-N,N'-diacetyllegionaminic acid synthase
MLGNIPLLGWTAEAIKKAGLSEATSILSTDDEEIASIGREVGLEVPFIRPAELAADETVVTDVVFHALDWLNQEKGMRPELVMLLQPTSPFRHPELLLKAIQMLEEPSINGVLGVKAIHRNLSTLFHADDKMNLVPLDENRKMETRRQKVNTIYTPNGALYLIRTNKLHGPKGFFNENVRGVVMDQIASIDIDDPLDWKLAEAVVSSKLSWRDKLTYSI